LFCDPSAAAQILLIIRDVITKTSSHIPKSAQGEKQPSSRFSKKRES